jgi:adenylate cyclase
MRAFVQIRIYENQQLVHVEDCDGAIELGRQAEGEPPPLARLAAHGRRRLVIATRNERAISRQHLLLEPLGSDSVRLTNLMKSASVVIDGGAELGSLQSREVSLPVFLHVGNKVVRIQEAEAPEHALHTLPVATVPPGGAAGASLLTLAAATPAIEETAVLIWLRGAMDVLQSAASSADFFDRAARAAVDLVGLDAGRVLLLTGDAWKERVVAVAALAEGGTLPPPSRHVLGRLRMEKKTIWQQPAPLPEQPESMRELEAVVAAPILDRHGAVLGALYGERRRRGAVPPRAIRTAEAMLVEVLAGGVAAGLARLEQEQAALAARVQFEQFFTPELAHELQRQPDLLAGRDAEISMLFCDIRGFSRISERLGPAATVAWVGDVMATLSRCVLVHQGVLVDYIGDELVAMWGAPREQADHARLACRAALDMLGCLPALNLRWEATLEEPMDVGIGVNSGLARVGNIGSPCKFKYGPLGNTVNLASRVQGATKYLKCPVLITGATRAGLDATFLTRRLCQARVVNIAGAVELHEVFPEGQAGWPAVRDEYEKALQAFEQRRFGEAARALGIWRMQGGTTDGPALVLLHRAVECMVEEPEEFDPVWVLPGK